MPAKKRRKNTKSGERPRQKEFIKMLTILLDCYVFIDKDSPNRVFNSGWDFMVAMGGKVVFVECKHTKKGQTAKLSPYQEFTKKWINKTGNTYALLDFNEDRGDRLYAYYGDDAGKSWEPLEFFIKHLAGGKVDTTRLEKLTGKIQEPLTAEGGK